MVVLDTNVVSELMRGSPSDEVRGWVDSQRTRALFVSTVTEAEIRAGVAVLPAGARRRNLADAVERMFANLLAGRVLPFDSPAARVYAEMYSVRRASGRPLALADGQIAAIARSRGMAVATRNIADFEALGIELVDPWAPIS